MISDVSGQVLTRRVQLRNPFRVDHLSILSKLHSTAYRPRRRHSKRFVGKPTKWLFHLMLKYTSFNPCSSFLIDVGENTKRVRFNSRNSQFGAIYQPQYLPFYEPETSALLDILVGNEDVFFDIGANWGYFAILLASRSGFRGHVEAFEPYPPTFRDLVDTVEQAGLKERITCHPEALSDHNGTATMAPWDGFQSGLARLGSANVEPSERMEVPVRKLDFLSLGTPDVVKMDVEDHEEAVLAGASEMLAQVRPLIIFENWINWNKPRLTVGPFEILSRFDYRFFVMGWAESKDSLRFVPKLSAQDFSEATLALIPFGFESRFFFPEQLNILAVPGEKIDALQQPFTALKKT